MGSGVQIWQEIPEKLDLGPCRVDVWRIPTLEASSSRPRCSSVLSPAERRRAVRFAVPSLRQEFVLVHGALRLILSRYLNFAPGALRFEAEENGKPVLAVPAGDPPLQFNLSHTRGCALVGVASDRSVGIDVERIRDDLDPLGLARRFFATEETEQLMALDDRAQCRPAFFRFWTLKEAYLKLKGAGLPSGLNRFQVDFMTGGSQAILRSALPGDDPGRFHLDELKAGLAYAAALAVEGPAPQIRCLDAKDLSHL